jgi:hypothetical protein
MVNSTTKVVTALSLIDSIPQEEKPWIRLVGEDGNAYAILARVRRAWKRKKRPDIADEYSNEAMSGNYSHLLLTSLRYINEKKDRYNESDDENEPEEHAEQLEDYQFVIREFWHRLKEEYDA